MKGTDYGAKELYWNDFRFRLHVEWLIEHNLTYHFDDDPDDIIWNPPTTRGQLENIKRWHKLMWNTEGFDIWEFFDRHEDLWSAYTGE